MKKAYIALAALALAFSTGVSAHGNQSQYQSAQGVAGVGVAGAAYGGTISGTASSESVGNAVAATQIMGSGLSIQGTEGYAGSSANIGGVITSSGAQVTTGVSQYAHQTSAGITVGNVAAQTPDGLIANGTGGVSQTNAYSHGESTFNAGAFGAGLVAGGFAGFQTSQGYGGYNGYNH